MISKQIYTIYGVSKAQLQKVKMLTWMERPKGTTNLIAVKEKNPFTEKEFDKLIPLAKLKGYYMIVAFDRNTPHAWHIIDFKPNPPPT